MNLIQLMNVIQLPLWIMDAEGNKAEKKVLVLD